MTPGAVSLILWPGILGKTAFGGHSMARKAPPVILWPENGNAHRRRDSEWVRVAAVTTLVPGAR